MFVDNSQLPQGSRAPGGNNESKPKRPRSSLACIRCRKKKVKCDFVQPTCGRCAVAGLPCSYATPPRRVDGHAFDLLGNHVEELKERMQRMQSELQMMKTNLHPFTAENEDGAGGSGNAGFSGASASGLLDPLAQGFGGPLDQRSLTQANKMVQLIPSSPQPQPVTWKLSLSPSGLRIDTNIASVADLYSILLNGISQLNINPDAATNIFSTDSLRGDGSKRRSASALWKARQSQGTIEASALPSGNALNAGTSANATGGAGQRLWEVSDTQAQQIIKDQNAARSASEDVPQESLDVLMHTYYHGCFTAYQIVDIKAFIAQYDDPAESLDPLLLNSIYAWMSKHGCIHHNTNTDRDPTTLGESYFKQARQLLKKCFDISSATTIHALLNLYMYQLNSERPSQAYLYIGLAIRMAQDLKLHKSDTPASDAVQKEMNKRLWWSAYWLDLCAALETNRPTMVDDKDCDLEYPSKMDHEDDETGYRVEYCVHSIKLMKIRKDITKHLPSEQSGQSLLSAISKLENSLTNWFNALPRHLQFNSDAPFEPSNSFRDESCLILNVAYHTTWIMLHKFFLPKQDQTATPVALLSLNICTKSANMITKILDLYAKHFPWCQFFYTLDGAVASVRIHQQNALSQDHEVATLAQRNLIITTHVLKKSPLIYMEKVNDIIDTVEEYLQKHGIPLDLDEIPIINENVVNNQSLSSVFTPPMFIGEQAANPGTNAGGQPPSQHPHDTQQQQQHARMGSFSMPNTNGFVGTGKASTTSATSPAERARKASTPMHMASGANRSSPVTTQAPFRHDSVHNVNATQMSQMSLPLRSTSMDGRMSQTPQDQQDGSMLGSDMMLRFEESNILQMSNFNMGGNENSNVNDLLGNIDVDMSQGGMSSAGYQPSMFPNSSSFSGDMYQNLLSSSNPTSNPQSRQQSNPPHPSPSASSPRSFHPLSPYDNLGEGIGSSAPPSSSGHFFAQNNNDENGFSQFLGGTDLLGMPGMQQHNFPHHPSQSQPPDQQSTQATSQNSSQASAQQRPGQQGHPSQTQSPPSGVDSPYYGNLGIDPDLAAYFYQSQVVDFDNNNFPGFGNVSEGLNVMGNPMAGDLHGVNLESLGLSNSSMLGNQFINMNGQQQGQQQNVGLRMMPPHMVGMGMNQNVRKRVHPPEWDEH
ncbi:hypothetical protein BZG36_04492 [Bifiguratus adelaidae]|uniref:Zn(2)-C6 fungal-type domain-containing protein n=1 Tax=Bifiguratus adelaidae TaxID=1938954 RepID=A0A261XYC8_9FUNG|nr:hypothetical protein BZG36_04492 [Bifiguratus adelaidae]